MEATWFEYLIVFFLTAASILIALILMLVFTNIPDSFSSWHYRSYHPCTRGTKKLRWYHIRKDKEPRD